MILWITLDAIEEVKKYANFHQSETTRLVFEFKCKFYSSFTFNFVFANAELRNTIDAQTVHLLSSKISIVWRIMPWKTFRW